jgi:hypothetical protein
MRRSDLPAEALAPRRLLAALEGGSIYAAESLGSFYLVIDESTMADLLSERELEGLDLVKVLEFESSDERAVYLLDNYGI